MMLTSINEATFVFICTPQIYPFLRSSSPPHVSLRNNNCRRCWWWPCPKSQPRDAPKRFEHLYKPCSSSLHQWYIRLSKALCIDSSLHRLLKPPKFTSSTNHCILVSHPPYFNHFFLIYVGTSFLTYTLLEGNILGFYLFLIVRVMVYNSKDSTKGNMYSSPQSVQTSKHITLWDSCL